MNGVQFLNQPTHGSQQITLASGQPWEVCFWNRMVALNSSQSKVYQSLLGPSYVDFQEPSSPCWGSQQGGGLINYVISGNNDDITIRSIQQQSQRKNTDNEWNFWEGLIAGLKSIVIIMLFILNYISSLWTWACVFSSISGRSRLEIGEQIESQSWQELWENSLF